MGLPSAVIRLVCIAVFLLVGTDLAAESTADEIRWNLAVDVGSVPPSSRAALSERVAEALRARLETARIKDFVVRVKRPGLLEVETARNLDSDWLESLLVRHGVVELRPLRPDAVSWLELAGELPDGVELRGGLDEPAYPWAPQRTLMDSVVRRVSVPEHRLLVVPDASGYRVEVLGPRVRADLRPVEPRLRLGKTVHVEFELPADEQLQLAGPGESRVQRWGLVIDDEFIGFVSVHPERSAYYVSPPRAYRHDAAVRWAKLVTAKMAAPIRVPIARMRK